MKKYLEKCHLCGRRRVFSDRSIYCLRCHRFLIRMDQRGLHADAVKTIKKWVKHHGFACFYTGMALDLKNPKSPWYYEFDHMIPANPRTMVLTCALINEMKSVMTKKEFFNIVRQLFQYQLNGKKFKKIKLAYWEKQGPHAKLAPL